MTKIWVTKYALTEGIIECDAKIADDNHGTAVTEVYRPWARQYFHGEDWHYSLVEAQERAGGMKAQKIASLQKAIAKLEKMTEFKVISQ